ncbi:4'-phosphopantetheinyl transferase Sfp [bioreactor metagenome]|uniref:4'-phosphopantetheinyl transferase Sfp n=1 Tax=bioreactor metagenome TaxID=1076179 RepID=A0A644Z3T1_9ZZZZ
MKVYVTKIKEVSEEILEELIKFISKEKKSKLQKLKHREDKLRSLIGEILVRYVIGENTIIEVNDIIFETNIYGKPYLRNYSDFHFNISHSGDFVICAIDNKPIGVDIEKVIPLEYEAIANNFFTTREMNYIKRENLRNQLSKFYEIWTIKESYVKAYGQGFNMCFKDFSMDYNEEKYIGVIRENKYDKCNIKVFNLESDYKVAICSFNPIIFKHITYIDVENLISNFLYTKINSIKL